MDTTTPLRQVETFALAGAFLDAFSQHRYDDLARLMTPDARFRALLPPRTLDGGPDLLVEGFHAWFGDEAVVEEASLGAAGPRLSIHYRALVHRDGVPMRIEQHLYLDTADDRITAVDLLCSGFHAAGAR